MLAGKALANEVELIERAVMDADVAATLTVADLDPEAKQIAQLTFQRLKIGIYRTPEPGVWRVNTTRLLGFDGTDPDDLTRAEIEGRKQVFALLEFMRRECPGRVRWTSSTLTPCASAHWHALIPSQ